MNVFDASPSNEDFEVGWRKMVVGIQNNADLNPQKAGRQCILFTNVDQTGHYKRINTIVYEHDRENLSLIAPQESPSVMMSLQMCFGENVKLLSYKAGSYIEAETISEHVAQDTVEKLPPDVENTRYIFIIVKGCKNAAPEEWRQWSGFKNLSEKMNDSGEAGITRRVTLHRQTAEWGEFSHILLAEFPHGKEHENKLKEWASSVTSCSNDSSSIWGGVFRIQCSHQFY